MSGSSGWFGSSSSWQAGMSSLAKSAMAEAQKTIEKAREMKEEYEAQERERLAALEESGDLDDGTDFDGMMWGGGGGFATQPTKKSINDNAVIRKSESEPVSLQPKSQTSTATVVTQAPSSGFHKSSPKSSSTPPTSQETTQIDVNDKDTLVVDSEEGFTSHDLIATADENSFTSGGGVAENRVTEVISPVSSIEVINNFSAANDAENMPLGSDTQNNLANASMSSSGGATVVIQGPREPAEGMEDTSSIASSGGGNGNNHVISEEDQSSSKSYEIIGSSSSVMGGGASSPNAEDKKQNSSGHTSGDEIELATTTTSSDIEVISSPLLNSDRKAVGSPTNAQAKSSSTKNKPRSKGHLRTGSEISADGSSQDSSAQSSEIDRLLRKLSEMSEILDARESKLVEMSRTNFQLQERTTDLESQIREAKRNNAKLQEANLSSDEFTQRLSSMEKKLQQVTVERDKLKAENDKYRQDAASRMTQAQVEEILAEKDEEIRDLRSEGESLSKQVGKHTEATRKLKSKEKSNEKEITTLRDKVSRLQDENERLKKNLSSKNEVESKQIEAVRDLSTANAQWEQVAKKTASDLEDARDQVGALKISLEGAYKELSETRRQLAENSVADHEEALAREAEARKAAEDKLRSVIDQNRSDAAGLFKQIDELRVALASEERSGSLKEERMRREREELLQRLTDSESRHEELSGSVSTATRPLLRQIESLQLSLKEAQSNSDRMEKSFKERHQQTSLQLASVQERERAAAEQYRVASSRVSGLEGRLKTANTSLAESEAKVEALEVTNSELEKSKAKEVAKTAALKKSLTEDLDRVRTDFKVLEAELESERMALSDERLKCQSLSSQLSDKERRLKESNEQLSQTRRLSERVGSLSPTPSQSASQAGGTGDYWNLDDAFDSSRPGRGSALLPDSAMSSALMDSLQERLKLREGEVVQLQMEVTSLERVREAMTTELAKASEAANEAAGLRERVDALSAQYSETEQKYQTMLTMYGEKVEEAEELRLDLSDVKEMYKVQIQDLLKSAVQK